jgi:hypothetical protein
VQAAGVSALAGFEHGRGRCQDWTRLGSEPPPSFGVVYASNEKAALKAAIDQLNIPPGQRDQLLIRRQV